MSSQLMKASHEWSSRPEDQRFVSLYDLADHCERAKQMSAAKCISTRAIEARPVEGDDRALVVVGPNGGALAPTHWAFGQLAQRASAPAGYLRDLPAPLAADCINYGLRAHDAEDTGVLLRKDPESGIATLNAVTGPNYGRVWNATIARALADRFGAGDGSDGGSFKVPGEFGKAVKVTKGNTTLYASDRDMFAFLADEEHRIEIPDRRDGKTGTLARGFFIWNSEVGSQTFGLATFLFDYVCCNRIVWGAKDYKEIRIRHTSSAPHRWIGEVAPAIERYAESSTQAITDAVKAAQSMKLTSGVEQSEREDAIRKFLSSRFTRSQATAIAAAHLADEGRPIETLWDAVTGATAYARAIPYQDERVEIERKAGAMLDAA